jgi:hypothetical protein
MAGGSSSSNSGASSVQCRSTSSASGAGPAMVAPPGELAPEQQQQWLACVELLLGLGFDAVDADKIVARAFGWATQVRAPRARLERRQGGRRTWAAGAHWAHITPPRRASPPQHQLPPAPPPDPKRHQAYWRREKVQAPPDASEAAAALELLREIGVAEADLARVVKVCGTLLG